MITEESTIFIKTRYNRQYVCPVWPQGQSNSLQSRDRQHYVWSLCLIYSQLKIVPAAEIRTEASNTDEPTADWIKLRNEFHNFNLG
jgi:hypothetical protein